MLLSSSKQFPLTPLPWGAQDLLFLPLARILFSPPADGDTH